jgi:hypothetical protein
MRACGAKDPQSKYCGSPVAAGVTQREQSDGMKRETRSNRTGLEPIRLQVICPEGLVISQDADSVVNNQIPAGHHQIDDFHAERERKVRRFLKKEWRAAEGSFRRNTPLDFLAERIPAS